jgi:hypothetical protein
MIAHHGFIQDFEVGGVNEGVGVRYNRSGSAEQGQQSDRAHGTAAQGGIPLPSRGSGGVTPEKILRFYEQTPAY